MKKIAENIYVHKNYISKYIPQDVVKLINTVMNDDVDVVKFNIKINNFSLIYCHSFDEEREPSIIKAENYIICENIIELNSVRNYNFNNCPIYHHKHMFVENNYTGFDLEKSKQWSEKWQSYIPKELKKIIGYKQKWQEIIEKYIDKK